MRLKKIFKNFFDIKSSDNILIITDKNKLKIAKRFLKVLETIANTDILIKSIGKFHGEEPSKNISEKMLRYDIIFAITTNSLTHTKARTTASRKGIRVASMPGFTEQMLSSLEVNPLKMLEEGRKLQKILLKSNEIRVTTSYGTDITFSIKKRIVEIDSGIFKKPGTYGNLPAGEVSVSPLEGTASGMIVINSMEDFVKPNTIVYVEKGKAIHNTDKTSKLSKIFKTIKNSTNIAEFGIGLNYKAKIIGNILQDEKVKRTCHIAFGNNKSYGGKVYSKVHLDAILFEPDIWFDGKKIISKGKLYSSSLT